MAPTRGPLNACFSTAAALTLDRHRNLHKNGRGVLRKPPDGSSKATSVGGGVESHLDVVQLRGSTSGSSPEFLLPASTICNDVGFCFSSAVDSGLRCSVVELFYVYARNVCTKRSNHLNATWTKLTQTAANTLCYGERASGEWIVRIEIKRNSSTRPKMMHERLPLKSFLVHKQAFKEGSSSAFRIVYF
ncbi:hypothetical protein T05_7338 [Trichinella murrelli]|uniref:Uncharacterized protein n=1 Tax=Trichinella murrelli TaxID=144512 RepID=A0A0V0TQH6_9BILA|nr:hypothetical protein T05_7338 [Trichinella murrelli]